MIRLFLTAALHLLYMHGISAEPLVIRSPSEQLEVRVELHEGAPVWSALLGGRALVEAGALGLETDLPAAKGPWRIEESRIHGADTKWIAVWGNQRVVRDHYRGITLTLRSGVENAIVYHVELRAYDEGVGIRYTVPEQRGLAEVTIRGRRTGYSFSGDYKVYQNRKFEYGTKAISGMSKSEGAVTIDAGGSFVCLTDANRSDFSMVSWLASKTVPHTIIGQIHPSSGRLPFATSWEVMVVGETAADLYHHRYLVENLSEPCRIADPSWIKPGMAISQVRNARMVTSEMKKLMDFASANRIPYVEIDHSWNGTETRWKDEDIAFFKANLSSFWKDKPDWVSNVRRDLVTPAKGWVPFRPQVRTGGNFVDLDIPALTAYGKSLDPQVGVCVYVRSIRLREFGGEYPLDEVFAEYSRMGLAGVKPGFTPAHEQRHERAIAHMVERAAAHKLIVCIHDAYHPAGLSRTYPNLVNVEGGDGDEAEHSIPPEVKSLHDVMLPFTRLIMGPFDYTPEIGRESKTHCHQVAMIGVFHGRPTLRGGMTQWAPGVKGGKEIELVKNWPGIFDETRVRTDFGKSVTVARRSGETWFVTSLSGPAAALYEYPLDFLTFGHSYTASIHLDTPGGREARHETRSVDASTVIPIAMEPDGGHLMIIEPARSK